MTLPSCLATIQDWAPVASTLLAAIAAGAAWKNVRQSRDQWLTERLPQLVAQLKDNVSEARVELHILNAGPGDARGVRFCVVAGAEYLSGYAGRNYGGLLRGGDTVTIATQLTTRCGP